MYTTANMRFKSYLRVSRDLRLLVIEVGDTIEEQDTECGKQIIVDGN